MCAERYLRLADSHRLAASLAVKTAVGNIGRHRHLQQLETVWVIVGDAILTLDQTDLPISIGQIIAIPIGLEHALRNEGQSIVELLTFFTPPLT